MARPPEAIPGLPGTRLAGLFKTVQSLPKTEKQDGYSRDKPLVNVGVLLSPFMSFRLFDSNNNIFVSFVVLNTINSSKTYQPQPPAGADEFVQVFPQRLEAYIHNT
ncbi:hypothetical protein BDBG_08471 [Blastomyces gilchristii SLH14081]|uniref:Uncharacterized protein n=1 Tax=Blastomyces gilchristii (strain SLH14081) TaxID=559298 RepID=A0A179V1L6_BLAGS|nr:uncharacterized protein BDBG_08471 [Blastomyces gilchristii SLH14081]OAT13221.1 hypothetical protein BDBG_08471 [Blastomyces gilchristii SLH14081]